ncbi:MAG: hypothetical protein ACD_60C00012G0011 [uncultured bacterium]|nr:MAG: hypothetical protein ACD_60C00012G0011 [uncultured bacterium]
MTKLIRGFHSSMPKGAVITIGNFDGVHRGHQALLQKVSLKARALATHSLAIIFEPQPREFFAKENKVARLTRFREKFFLLSKYGMDAVLVIRFNQHIAKLTAAQFVEQILVDALAAKWVIVGDDFQFGSGREGNVHFLQEAGKQAGFMTESIPSILLDQERVSSTRVRRCLAAFDHTEVQRLLGRPYTMQGRVVHGDKRGRIMGFPTANIYLHRLATPLEGIYVVRMHGIAKKALPGVASVGTRPTVGGTRCLLEVHLLNFNEDIYGRHVEIEFLEKLRDEEHFATIDLLIEQIKKDCDAARHYFEIRREL